MSQRPAVIEQWHEIVRNKDESVLAALLAPDVVFRSPAVYAPQEGHQVTLWYLKAALVVLGPTVAYHREWYAESSAILEFEANLDGVTVQGVDMISWNADGLITEFAVLVRPLSALNKLIELMAAQLASTYQP